MVTVTDYTAILSGDYWGGSEVTGMPVFVTYSFPASSPSWHAGYYSAGAIASFEAFTEADKTDARTALAKWSAVSGITFIEVDGVEGDINFSWYDFDLIPGFSTSSGFAYYPGGISEPDTGDNLTQLSDIAGDVFYNTNDNSHGGLSQHILLHEIGHAIGLKHTFEESPPDHTETLAPALDNYTYSTMSYTWSPNGDNLGLLDDDAVQHIYDASNTLNWSWNAAAGILTQTGTSGAQTMRGSSQKDVMSALGGNDILVGLEGDDTLDGGAGDDIVHGGGGGDRVGGGFGADTLYGDSYYSNYRGGSDIFVFATPGAGYSSSDIAVDFEDGADLVDVAGFGVSDYAMLSPHIGTNANWEILITLVYGGNDYTMELNYIYGSITAADFVFYTGGPRTAVGTDHTDMLFGGTGNDTLKGGAGGDELYGGQGVDLADYSNSNLGVNINLATGSVAGGDAAGDMLDSIENISGSQYADTLTGSGGNNVLYGNGGDDTLNGGADNDKLKGNAGGDTLNGDAGADMLYGGDDDDVLNGGTEVDYLYGDAGDDTLNGDEGNDRLIGGDGNDTLYGGAGDDKLKGKGGDDELHGGAGNDQLFAHEGLDTLYGDADDDYLYGGQDNDTLYGGTGIDRLRGNLSNDEMHGGDDGDFLYGGGQNDILFGDAGGDLLSGEGGRDNLNGGAGNDNLFGGDHDDILNGGAGDDVLRGEAGADKFAFAAGNEVDRVRDFTDGEDLIDLSSFSFADKATAMANAYQFGSHVRIDIGADRMIVENMTLNTDFTEDDIII